jgi:Amt family ammonium transporter
MENLFTINNVWMMVSIFLVFIMHLGFATLESGLCRSKNTVNILFKNIIIVAIGLLTYTFVGFNLMYPGAEYAGGFFGFSGFGLSLPENGLTEAYNPGYTYYTDFLFQAMFAATAATIVSGAVAERIKLNAFLIFSVIYVGLVYPIAGMWKWGGGFLAEMGFYDFAGSTLVHSVGGWASLVAVILLGPRLGKYNGTTKAIEGHSIPLAVIGVMLLWLGWFGFNGGSVLSANPGTVSLVLVTTCIAAASGAVGAFITSYSIFKSYDITMLLNGILAGLVGITAGADLMSVTDSILIGLVAGFIVVIGVIVLDKLKLDDPVGAIAVHLMCGIWGTFAVGLFGSKAGLEQIKIQLIGIVTIGLFCIVSAFIILYIIKKTIGLRVSEKEEIEGLDMHEHGMSAYAGFGSNDD